MHPHYLSTFLRPRSIALYGASARPGAVGAVLLSNLLEGPFQGQVYPINPKYTRVCGLPAYSSLGEVGCPVDLALIATPANTVAEVMEDVGRHAARGAVIFSSGFGELGESGKALEARVLRVAQRFGVRFLGPNCHGIIRPELGLNATPTRSRVQQGQLAVITQSGALGAAVTDWAEAYGVGFSSVFALGNSADIDFGELVELLLSDHQTHSILLHVEGIHDARRFLSGLRAAARTKPVLVLKSGRHLAGSRAVLSHTGALVGWDSAFEAALCRVGAVRVASFNQLFAAARTLSYGVRTRGNRLAIVTNGGGIGVMAADRLADLSLPVPRLAAQTVRLLASVLPRPGAIANPVDLSGDATPDHYRRAVEICLHAAEVDAVLAILCPQAMTQPQAVAEQMVALAKSQPKPLLACWLGESQVQASRGLFNTHRVPSYRTPEAAVEAFNVLACYQRNQQLLLQVPEPLGERVKPDLATARQIVKTALADKRGELTEIESRRLLAAFHIPMQKTLYSTSATELARMAEETGFPAMLRLDSPERAVRSEHVFVCDSYSLRSAYYRLQATVRKRFPAARIEGVLVAAVPGQHTADEMAVGVAEDPIFGPLITVSSEAGSGKDSRSPAVALPPLNRHLANDLVRHLRVSAGLEEVAVGAMEDMLLRLSEMVCALPELGTVDLAPVLVSQQAVTVCEVRITVRGREQGRTPYAHMAIHPYPTELVCRHISGADTITIRPIRPEDAVIERAFVHALSSRSKYLRFMTTLNELSPEMLSRFTQIDYDREMALIAVTKSSGAETELGVARYATNPDGESCEFGLVVADVWQRRGIGRRLMVELMACARQRGLRLIEGEVLRENAAVLALLRSLGFTVQSSADDPEIKVVVKELLS